MFVRINSIIPTLYNNALKSQLSHKHSALLIRNGKIVSYGINNIHGLDSYHAEINAIRNYLIKKGYIKYIKHINNLEHAFQYKVKG